MSTEPETSFVAGHGKDSPLGRRFLREGDSAAYVDAVIQGNYNSLQLKLFGLKEGPEVPGLRIDGKEVEERLPKYPEDYGYTVGRDGTIIISDAKGKPGNPLGPMIVGPAADNAGGPVYGLGGRIIADKARWEAESQKLLTHQVVLDTPEGLMALGHPTTKGGAEKTARHMVQFTTETLGPDAMATNIKAVDITSGEHVVDNSNLYGSGSGDEWELEPETLDGFRFGA